MTCESPLYIYPHSKTVLMQAINNDVTFLASQSVMDYSLLVGLDEMTQELVVGIIGKAYLGNRSDYLCFKNSFDYYFVSSCRLYQNFHLG